MSKKEKFVKIFLTSSASYGRRGGTAEISSPKTAELSDSELNEKWQEHLGRF